MKTKEIKNQYCSYELEKHEILYMLVKIRMKLEQYLSEYIPLGISREEIVNDCTGNPGHLSNILNSDLNRITTL
ncbi:MAG: hypothetical protein KQA34_01705 [Candidatus Aenigmarchaeota archaeon]|nr:hypothetical protein [Candidatus Aenigmarchaeota archaeon]